MLTKLAPIRQRKVEDLMDFGVFNLLQHRDRSKSPHQVIEEALSHTRLAEELGFGRVWFAEHHFSNYSLCPSPLIFCAQAAAMTKRIRVARLSPRRGGMAS